MNWPTIRQESASKHYRCRQCRHIIKPRTLDQRRRKVPGGLHFVIRIKGKKVRYCLDHDMTTIQEAILVEMQRQCGPDATVSAMVRQGTLPYRERGRPVVTFLQQLALSHPVFIDPDQVATKFGVHRSTVIGFLKKLDLPRRRSGRPKKHIPSPIHQT